MCLQCFSALGCASDKWQVLLYNSILGTAITMIDIYSDIFVVIDFLYQSEHYWAVLLIGIILLANSFTTREVIMIMEPESFLTLFCIAILSMLGFGPVVLLCYLFFDVDDQQKRFFSEHDVSEAQLSPTISSESRPYYHQLVTVETHMNKIRIIESFSESMLSFSLQITYLILLDNERIIYHQHLMIIISILLSLFSFGSGLAKWIINYATLSAFYNKSFLTINWCYSISGTIYFLSDLAMRIVSFVLFILYCEQNEYHMMTHICMGSIAFWEVFCCRIATKIWHQPYEMDDMLMDANGFMGGIFYWIVCLFSSYYYMSNLPLNCVTAFIMLARYIVNSAAFIVYFMSVGYSLSASLWALLYISLYALNLCTFVIWLMFKQHYLSSITVTGKKEPLLSNKSDANQFIAANEESISSVDDSQSAAIQMLAMNNTNVGMMAGYNPPTQNPQQLKLFQDYQSAIQLQQQQLYESALRHKGNPQHEAQSSISMNIFNPMANDMQQQSLLLQQQWLMQAQYNHMNVHNSELALKFEMHSKNKSQHLDDNAFEVLSEGVPLPNVEVEQSISQMDGIKDNEDSKDRNDTEQLYGNNPALRSDESQSMQEGSIKKSFSSVGDALDVSFGYNESYQLNKVKIENKSLSIQSTAHNNDNWYNVFGVMRTEDNVQYHWKIKVKQLNVSCDVFVGIFDTGSVAKYQNLNRNEHNMEHFCTDANGFGIDKNGNLRTGGENEGQYCKAINENDVMDVYFDAKQYSLWFGVNGKDFGVAYKINAKSSYRLAIAMFGANHTLEIVSYEVVRY